METTVINNVAVIDWSVVLWWASSWIWQI